MHRQTVTVRAAAKAALLLTGLVLTLGGCASEDTVSFGAVLSLSGPGAVRDVQRGMNLALDEINEDGGLNGRDIEVHVVDSSSNESTAREKLAELDEKQAPLLVFSTLSSVTKAVSPMAEQREIPLIGLVATDPSIPQGKQWTYVFYPSARHETEPIFTIMRQNRVGSLGIVHIDDAYGQSVVREMQRRAQGTTMRVEAAPYSGNDDGGLAAVVDRFRSLEAVYLVGFAQQILDMYQRFTAKDYGGILMSTSTATVPSLRAKHNLDDVYAGAPLIYNDSFVFAERVSERYRDRYDRFLSHYAATGYDILKIIAGMLEGEELTRQRVIEILERGFTYPGVFGEIRLPEGQNTMYFPLYPARIEEGELRYLK
jgi:branched-chain amino acid transport system substrate-binding protein